MRNAVAVSVPKHVWTLLAVYFFASLAHFAHNAEFIAYYPNMPAWLTRDATNATIWFEVIVGFMLMLASALLIARRVSCNMQASRV